MNRTTVTCPPHIFRFHLFSFSPACLSVRSLTNRTRRRRRRRRCSLKNKKREWPVILFARLHLLLPLRFGDGECLMCEERPMHLQAQENTQDAVHGLSASQFEKTWRFVPGSKMNDWYSAMKRNECKSVELRGGGCLYTILTFETVTIVAFLPVKITNPREAKSLRG